MRITILYSPYGPFKAFTDFDVAHREWKRLQALNDLVDYSIIDLPVENPPHNNLLNSEREKLN